MNNFRGSEGSLACSVCRCTDLASCTGSGRTKLNSSPKVWPQAGFAGRSEEGPAQHSRVPFRNRGDAITEPRVPFVSTRPVPRPCAALAALPAAARGPAWRDSFFSHSHSGVQGLKTRVLQYSMILWSSALVTNPVEHCGCDSLPLQSVALQLQFAALPLQVLDLWRSDGSKHSTSAERKLSEIMWLLNTAESFLRTRPPVVQRAPAL